MKKIALPAILLLVFTGTVFGIAPGNTYHVTSTSNIGLNTLRAAIDSANANPGVDSIILDLTSADVIHVNSAFQAITEDVIITGQPCNNPTIDGGNQGFNNSLFWSTLSNVSVTLNYLNVTGCQLNTGQGAVTSASILFVNYCYFYGNSAYDNFDIGAGQGGAISTQTITATNGTFSSNYSFDAGGAIIAYTSGNFYNCTFNNNHSGTFGSAILVTNGNLINCTVANNLSDIGGALFSNGSGSFNIANSIIWGNTSGNTYPGIYYTSGINSGGCNILQPQGDDNGFNYANSDISGTDPNFGNFGYYGGCVPVLPILCNSVAVDHASCPGATAADARDIATYNGTRDAGAFELNNPVTPINLGPNVSQCGGTAVFDAGNPGDTYIWSNGSTNEKDTVSTSGTYSVTVTNNVGCSATASVQAYIKPLPVVSLGPDIFECGGQPVLNASNPGDAYLWSTGETTQFITATTSNIYSVTVTDQSSLCTAASSVKVTIPPVPVVTVTPSQSNICAGDSVMLSADFTVGGQPPVNSITYDIDLANLVNLPLNCSGGTSYYSTIVNGFSGFQWNDAGQGNAIAVQVSFSVGVECSNAGTVHPTALNITPGPGYPQTPVNCDCINSPTNVVTLNMPVTSYQVGGANAFSVQYFGQSWGLVPTASLNGHYAQVTVTYQQKFTWSTGDTTPTIKVSPASSTNYTVTGTYSGCSGSASAQVNVTARPVVDLGSDTTLCGGPLTLNAGNPGDFYSWSDLSGNQTLVVSTGNTYSVTVTEPTNDCSAADTINVTILPAPVVNLGPGITLCGGSTTIDAGNTGSNYVWSDGSTNESLVVSTSGTYSVTVTNPSNCSAGGSVEVYIQPAPIVNLGTDTFRCGGTVTLDAGNPGDIYLWSDQSTGQTLTASSGGQYSVTVTDPNSSCSANGSVFVGISPVPVVNLGPNITQCGGSVVLDAGNPGQTYTWSDGSDNETLVVSTSGTYSVTVVNDGGCAGTASIEVYIQPVPAVNLGPDVNQCGGSVTLNAGNNNDTYAWSDNSTNQILLVTSTGTYNVTVTDLNSSCTAADTVNISINIPPVVSLGPAINQCGGTDTLDAGNANTGDFYNWSDGSTSETLVVSTSGTYSVTVTNDGNCSASSSVEVYIKSVPVVNLGPDARQCGGTVTLDAGHPGNTYGWSTGETTQTIMTDTTGSYMATVTDINTGCSAADTVLITIDTIPVVNLGPDTAQCGGTVILFAGNAGSTYLWSDGTVKDSFVVSVTGIYRVSVTNSNNCSATGSVTVTINPVPVVGFTLPANICITEQPFFLDSGTPAGGFYFESGAPIVVFTPVTQGIGAHQLTYIYTSPAGCTDSASADIFVRPQPFIHTALPPDLCVTSTPIDLDQYFTPQHGVYSGLGVSDHFFYSQLSPAGNDTIYDIFTSDYGCKDTSAYPIVVHRPAHVSMTSSVADYTICAGQSITFTATGADMYQFFVNDTAQGPASANNTFTTTTLINHSEITVVGSNACSSDTSELIVIDVIALPVVDAGRDTTIALGTTIQLQGTVTGSGLFTYLWTPPNGLNLTNVINPYFSGTDTTYFTLIAAGLHGCIDSAHVTVNVYVPEAVQLPNTITPDGDGINDLWKISPKINLDGSHLTIFNRWGETVYDVENYANNWDGTYKSTGRKLPDGTYYYVLKVPNEQNHTYRGAINILNSTLN